MTFTRQSFLGRALCALFLGITLAAMAACQDSNNSVTTERDLLERGYYSAQEGLLLNNSLRVVDDNQQPVAQAQVMIGPSVDQPFTNNIVTTDDEGFFPIPPQWTQALPVSITSPGYVHTTFENIEPYSQDFQLSIADGTQNIEVKGEATGFKNIRTDGQIDFGLIIPGFTRKALIRFDISDVISPSNDDISVLGFTFGVPSNLTLPRQRESYIFPIEFNKPNFRVYSKSAGTFSYLAAQGNFPLKKVFDEIRNGRSIFELVNDLSFQRAGIQQVNVLPGGVNTNLNVASMELTSNVTLQAPTYSSDYKMFGMSAIEQNGMLFPADLKMLQPNQRQRLKAPAQGNIYKASLLIQDYSSAAGEAPNFQQMSISLQEGQDASPARFLPMIDRPSISSSEILLDKPAMITGVRPLAMILILSEVESITGGAISSERRTRLWEIVSNTWVDRVELPDFQFTKKPNRSYRWEVLYLGQDEAQVPSNSLDAVTHITRNAASL